MQNVSADNGTWQWLPCMCVDNARKWSRESIQGQGGNQNQVQKTWKRLLYHGNGGMIPLIWSLIIVWDQWQLVVVKWKQLNSICIWTFEPDSITSFWSIPLQQFERSGFQRVDISMFTDNTRDQQIQPSSSTYYQITIYYVRTGKSGQER